MSIKAGFFWSCRSRKCYNQANVALLSSVCVFWFIKIGYMNEPVRYAHRQNRTPFVASCLQDYGSLVCSCKHEDVRFWATLFMHAAHLLVCWLDVYQWFLSRLKWGLAAKCEAGECVWLLDRFWLQLRPATLAATLTLDDVKMTI